MMSETSSDDYDTVGWNFYSEREEWKDIKPIPQEEGPQPIVAIAYSAKFKDVYDYIRACLYANEISERALDLTKDALILNAANYTVWQYRRMILQQLNRDFLELELSFSKSMIIDHQKNYQVWHHRMVIVQWLNDPGNELNFIAQMLKEDPKNYHAWQYRQWVLSTFKLYENELQYTKELLEDDIRNNSAWNHRYFVINHITDFAEHTIKKEIAFTMNAIEKAKKNESPWNYLRGLLIHATNGLLETEVIHFCENLYLQGNRSPHLLAYLIDVASENADIYPDKPETEELLKRAMTATKSRRDISWVELPCGTPFLLLPIFFQTAFCWTKTRQRLAPPKYLVFLMCKNLATDHDKIRQNYWNYISNTLKDKLKKISLICDNSIVLEL